MNKTVIIAIASLLAGGAVTAAIVTGVKLHSSSTAQPVRAEAGTDTQKRVVRKEHAAGDRVARVASAPPPPPCTNCGVVESIESFADKGQASGGGAVAGGLLGGILGHQIGKGRGKELATVAGVVGGALAGNEIEKNSNKTMGYHVGVRMDDGTRAVLTLNSVPNIAVGDHVKIVNGELIRD